MDEQNKQPEQQPEQQPACEKKLSRTTLTFYIVGLFSVAIALILISYVAQARADRQLDSLTDQELPALLSQPDARQLLHITYGAILRDAGLRQRLYALWNAHFLEYAQLLDAHLGRHLELLTQTQGTPVSD